MMSRYLRDFQLDRLSFWIGFLAATLFWWLLGRLRSLYPKVRQALSDRAQTARLGLTANLEIHLRNDTLRQAQRQHLASLLFSLDEILIPPRFIAPPHQVEPGTPPPLEDLASQVLPYQPDWPEMASTYGSPTLNLVEALGGGANLIIFGEPGSGKSVALAHLVSQIARRDPATGDLAQFLPVMVHAADLVLPPSDPQDPLSVLVAALSPLSTTLTQSRLPVLLNGTANAGTLLLLLDGMDELPPQDARPVIAYLEQLVDQYPALRAVVATSPQFFGDLPRLGFYPLAIAVWDERDRSEFITRWSELFNRYIMEQVQISETQDPDLLNSWLLQDSGDLTPLELTLKIWAAYAGDVLGQNTSHGIEAYIRRLTAGIPKGRLAMEKLALQVVVSQKAVMGRKEAETWISEFDPALISEERAAKTSESGEEPVMGQAIHESVTSHRVIPALLENGAIRSYYNAQLSLVHPVITGYLASCAILSSGIDHILDDHPDWIGKNQALHFLGIQNGGDNFVERYLEKNKEPLHRELFNVARFLRYAKEDVRWKSSTLRQLARIMQSDAYPLGLRSRATTAMALSNNPGVVTLFRQMLSSQSAATRQLVALGCGQLRDPKMVDDLTTLLADPNPNVFKAACLALVAIGNKTAIEAVVSALLQGSKELRQAAAEALANHPEEGHPFLKEASQLEDLMVRRASIAGLLRVAEPWAIQILEKIQVEDSQWVAKNAAAQALDNLERPNPYIPHPLPALTETPWLIAFAGERGIGIAPGKPAMELVLMALKEGNEEQRLAAMDYLKLKGDPSAVLPLYDTLYSTQGEIQEAALQTLWQLSAMDIELPVPTQFGLGKQV
jgi:hypothetical protein